MKFCCEFIVHSLLLSHEIHNGNTGTYLIMENRDKIVERSNWRAWESVKNSGGLFGKVTEQLHERTYRE